MFYTSDIPDYIRISEAVLKS